MDFINEIFDGIEYTLVEVYPENDPVYHFNSDIDEIFCVKRKEKYIKINDDDKISEIKAKYGLENCGMLMGMFGNLGMFINGARNIRNVDDEEKQKMIKEVVNNLLKINPNIDDDKISKRLNQVKMCKCTWKVHIAGAYQPGEDTVFLGEDYAIEQDKESKHLQLHEFVHSLLGQKFGLDVLNSGLNEGITENITLKAFEEHKSSNIMDVKFNFSYIAATYAQQVALVKQMEYALGRELKETEDILNPYKFLKEFSNAYGRDTYRFVRHGARRLLSDKVNEPSKYFSSIQDILLVKIFDKELESVKDLESAQKYLEKLQGFELVRGDVSGNNFFQKYYESKREFVKEKMMELGMPEEILDLKLKRYEKSKFYELFTDKELQNDIYGMMALMVEKDKIKDEKTVNEYKCFVGKAGEKNNYCMMMKNDELFQFAYSDPECVRVASKQNGRVKLPEKVEIIKDDKKGYKIKLNDGLEVDLEETTIPEDISMKAKQGADRARRQREQLKDIAEKEPRSFILEAKSVISKFVQHAKNGIKEVEVKSSDR